MTDVAITILPAAPLHVLELWAPAALDFELPPMGRSRTSDALTVMRVEPTVWLVEGDVAPLDAQVADAGALTAVGGGIVRVRLSGPGWRVLLMEGAVFDAESPAFGPGCCAATIIDHVNVRLHVRDALTCDVYVPASYSAGVVRFWEDAAATL